MTSPEFTRVRKVYISWRPDRDGLSDQRLTTADWVNTLKTKLETASSDDAGRKILVKLGGASAAISAVNTGNVGKAWDRDGPFTDFVCVLSDDYIEACREEVKAKRTPEVLVAVDQIPDTLPMVQTRPAGVTMPTDTVMLWNLPVNKLLYLRAEVEGITPWGRRGWHHLKPEEKTFSVAPGQSVHSEIFDEAVRPIVRHTKCVLDCWVGPQATGPQTQDGSGRSWLGRLVTAFKGGRSPARDDRSAGQTGSHA